MNEKPRDPELRSVFIESEMVAQRSDSETGMGSKPRGGRRSPSTARGDPAEAGAGAEDK